MFLSETDLSSELGARKRAWFGPTVMVLSDSNRASVPMTPLIEEEQGPFQFMLENTRLFCAGNRKKQVSPCLPSLPHIYWTDAEAPAAATTPGYAEAGVLPLHAHVLFVPAQQLVERRESGSNVAAGKAGAGQNEASGGSFKVAKREVECNWCKRQIPGTVFMGFDQCFCCKPVRQRRPGR